MIHRHTEGGIERISMKTSGGGREGTNAIRRRLVDDENGAVTAEYAVLLTLVALAALVGAGLFGAKLGNIFTSVVDALDDVIAHAF